MAATMQIRMQKPIFSLFTSNVVRRNPVLLAPTHIRFRNPYQISKLKLNSTKQSTLSSLKCFHIINNPKVVTLDKIDEHDHEQLQEEKNPIEKFIEACSRALRRNPAAIVILLAGLLLCLVFFYPNSAFAASGRSMGGGSFSSSGSSSYKPALYSSSRESGFWYWFVLCLMCGQLFLLILLLILNFVVLWRNTFMRTSVFKLQVGLSGSSKSLLGDLNRIADTTDSSTREGRRYMLTETISTLRQHSDDCIYGYSSVDVKRGLYKAERQFKKLSIEERDKFDKETETLVYSNNTEKQSSTIKPACTGVNDEYIVVTILVANEEKSELLLPTINSSSDLEEALQKLASINTTSGPEAVEVLWTPKNEDDVLSKPEFLEKYALLQPLLE